MAGVIGNLQPRFHLHGPVMSTAQRLEESCLSGSVHISVMMADLLKLRAGSEHTFGYKLPSPLLAELHLSVYEELHGDLKCFQRQHVSYRKSIQLGIGLKDAHKIAEKNRKLQDLCNVKMAVSALSLTNESTPFGWLKCFTNNASLQPFDFGEPTCLIVIRFSLTPSGWFKVLTHVVFHPPLPRELAQRGHWRV